MNKVLITGGAGFIGSHTADLLLKEGIRVRVLDNLSSGHRHNLPDRHPLLEFIEGDISDTQTVKNAMDGASHCLHLAAQVSVASSLEDPGFSAKQNILGFINVLDAARRSGAERFVYASSAAVYGEPPMLPLDEEVPVKQLSPYGLEKQVNEHYADLYHRLYGLSSLGMRYFNVFGPRQDPKSPYAGVIALFVDRISANRPLTIFGNGKQTRDFIYVKDIARANIAALKSSYNGVCNAATGKSTSLLDLIDILSGLAGNRPPVDFTEAREGDITHSLADTSRMHKELGLKAETPLKDGLSALLGSI